MDLRKYYNDPRYDGWIIPGIDFFFIGIGFYTILYLIFHRFLKMKNTRYRTLSLSRQVYVLKNLSKSIGLMIVLYYSYTLLYVKFMTGYWINHLIYKVAFFIAAQIYSVFS